MMAWLIIRVFLAMLDPFIRQIILGTFGVINDQLRYGGLLLEEWFIGATRLALHRVINHGRYLSEVTASSKPNIVGVHLCTKST